MHIYDVGPHFNDRGVCPLTLPASKKRLTECPKPRCNYCGPADSAGNVNDFKLCLTASEVIGGSLWRQIGQKELQRLIDSVHRLIVGHAPCELPVIRPNEGDLRWIRREAAAAGLVYHHQDILHAGSDNAPAINQAILETICRKGKNLEFHWNTNVLSVRRQGAQFVVRYQKNRNRGPEDLEQEQVFDYVVIAVGRGGTRWLIEQEFYRALNTVPGTVDIGVRVEVLESVMEEIDSRFYEPKLYGESSWGDTTRNFCSNPGGEVVPENHKAGYILVNGHAKMHTKTANNNFAVLVRQQLTLPFKHPHLYSQTVASLVNQLAGGGVLVQRLGDLLAKRRTWPAGLEANSNSVRPTYQAQPGDLSLGYPGRLLGGIVEYLQALDVICPGVAGRDTLLYGPEAKSYPDEPELKPNMETNLQNLFIAGDSSSKTRGLMQAFVSGLLAGRAIRRRCRRKLAP